MNCHRVLNIVAILNATSTQGVGINVGPISKYIVWILSKLLHS